MTPIPRDRWGGVSAAALTLFDAEGKIDWKAWREYLVWLSESGLAGILIMGTTGEFPLLTTEERLRGIEVAQEVIPKGIHLIVNVGAMSTAEAVTLAKASASGSRPADLLLCGPPYYYQGAFSETRFTDHMRTIGDACGIPLLYYHIPKMSHFNPSPEMLARVANAVSLQGIKDSDGDIEYQRELRQRCPAESFLYLSGSARAAPTSWDTQGDGAILGLASAMPSECAALWTLWNQGDRSALDDHHRRLCPVWAIASEGGVAGARALLGLMNPTFAHCLGRAPFTRVTDELQARIAKAMM